MAGRANITFGNTCLHFERVTCQFKQHYRRTRREVFPTLSRIQNIGYEQGENGRTAGVVSGQSSDALGSRYRGSL
jgi:hypothetical protein